MIINETKNTYEDIKYMFRKAKRTPLIIGCRLFFVIGGLYLIVEAFNLIQKNMGYFNYVSGSGQMGMDGVLLIALIALMILLGIAFFIFNFFFVKFIIYRNYKKIYSKWAPRHMEFKEDVLEISFEENGVSSNVSIQYDLFDAYSRCNDAVYIAVKMDGKKANKYLCLHDDAYLSGNVDELIQLLDEKIG